MQIELCKGQAFLVIEALGKLLGTCPSDEELVILEMIDKVHTACVASIPEQKAEAA